MNGYPESLLRIDDEMRKLGRPVPPVVSWLSRNLRGKNPNEAQAAWRREVEAWEEANPETAVQWLELRSQYAAEEERLEQLKYNPDAWTYALLSRLGCPQENLDVIRGHFRDTQSMAAAQRWLQNGTVWSLVLIGGHGCGKSSAAAWLAHQLLMRSYRPAWVDCAKQSQAPMYGVEAEHRRFLCRNAGVLVLDELGSKRQLEREHGPWLAWLDDVLGSRANERRKTIVTTNRTPDELGPWIGERLIDRLRAGDVHSSDEPSMRGTNT